MNEAGEVRGKVVLDVTGVDQGTAQATKSIQTFADNANRAGQEVREAFGDRLTDAIKAARLESDKLTASTGEERASIDVLGIAFQKLNIVEREQIGILTEQLAINAELVAAQKAEAAAVAQQDSETRKLSSALRDAQVAHQQFTATTEQERQSLSLLGVAYDKLNAEQQIQITAVAAQVTANAELVASQEAVIAAQQAEVAAAAEQDASMAKLAGGLGFITNPLVLVTEAVLGLGEALATAGRDAADFEQKTQRIQASTGLSDDALGKTRDSIIAIGTETGASFDSLEKGLKAAYKETNNLAESQAILQAATIENVGSGADLAATASTLATTLHETGMGVESVNSLLNLLQGVTERSKLEMGDFGDTFTKTAQLAHQLHVPLTDVLAAIETLQRNGMSANQAMTATGLILHGIAQPTKEVREAVDLLAGSDAKLKDEFSARGLAQRGLIGVMEDWGRHTQGNISSQNALFTSMRVGTGAVVLLNDAQGDYKRHLSENADFLAGTATPVQENYDKAIDSANTHSAELSNSTKALSISIGEWLNPVLVNATDSAKQFIDMLRGIAEAPKLSIAPADNQLSAQLDALKKFRAAPLGNGEKDTTGLPLKPLEIAMAATGIDYGATDAQIDAAIKKITDKAAAATAAIKPVLYGPPSPTAGDKQASEDYRARLEAQKKAQHDAAVQGRAAAREAAREQREELREQVQHVHEVNQAYTQLFRTIQGVELDKWAQKSFNLADQRDRYLDLIGDPNAVTKRGQEIVRAVHEALQKIHDEAVIGRAKLDPNSVESRSAAFFNTDPVEPKRKTDSSGEWARQWVEQQRAIVDAGDETRAALLSDLQITVGAIEDGGKKGTAAWVVLAEALKQINKEIASDNKRTLEEQAAVVKRVNEEVAHDLLEAAREQEGAFKSVGKGIDDLSGRFDRFAGHSDPFGDVVARLGIRPDQVEALRPYIQVIEDGEQELAKLETHRRELESITHDIEGPLDHAFSSTFEHGRMSAKTFFDSLRKDFDETLRHIAAQELAKAVTRGITGAAGKAIPWLSDDKLKTEASVAHTHLSDASHDLAAASETLRLNAESAARSIKEAAGAFGNGGSGSDGGLIKSAPNSDLSNFPAIDFSGAGSGTSGASGGSATAIDATAMTRSLQLAQQAKGGDLSGVIGSAGSLAALHASFAGGLGSSLAGLAHAMPWIGLGVGVDNLLGDPVGKLLGKLFHTHLHLATGAWEVPGSSFGDSVPAMLTPGEMVLPVAAAKAVRGQVAGSNGSDSDDGLHFHGPVTINDRADVARIRAHTTSTRRAKFTLQGGMA